VAILVTDNFNRADSGTIGNDSNGNAWVERAGAWEIFTSSVRQTDAVTVPGCLLCGTDTASVDHWAEVKLAVSDGSDQIGIVVRLDPTTFTGISMEVADGAYKLIRVVNGSPDTGATGDSHTHAAGEVYACEVIDSTDTINFYLNGALVFTTTGETHNAGDTRVGLHINADVGNNAVRWDNFRAGNGTYPGPVPPTLPTFVTAGTGVLTATSSAACTPGIPSGVIAGELLVAHVFYGGSTTTPDTPSGWSLLRGPDSLTTPSTNGRSWVFGKKAVGSDAAPAFGTQAVTTPRRARVYRFTNARDDTVANMVGGFNFETGSVATYPDVGVTTPEDNCLAINLVAQAENLPAAASFTGETSGDWVQAIAAFTGTTGTPDTLLQLQTAVMEATGTVNGGTFASGIAVPRGITGFYIRGPASSGSVTGQAVGSYAFTSTAAAVPETFGQAAAALAFTSTSSGVDRPLGVAAAIFAFTGSAAGQAGTPPVTGQAAGAYTFTSTAAGVPETFGQAATALGFTATALGIPRTSGAASGTYAFTSTADGIGRAVGTATASLVFGATAAGTPEVFGSAAASISFSGTAAGFAGTPPVTGQAQGAYTFTSAAAGTDRSLGAVGAALTFTGGSQGISLVIAAAVAPFMVALTASGQRKAFAAAAAGLTFSAVGAGFVGELPVPSGHPVTFSAGEHKVTVPAGTHVVEVR